MHLSGPFVLYRLPNHNTIHLLYGNEVLQLPIHTSLSHQKGFVVAPFAAKDTAYVFTDKQHAYLSSDDVLSLDIDISLKEVSCFNTDFDQYRTQIEHIQNAIQVKQLDKAVLSRVISVPKSEAINLKKLFVDMHVAYPDAFVYMACLPDNSLWCGATPETLAHYQDNTLSTMALAGTQVLEARRAKEVLWSAKEQAEQQWVQDHIAQLFENADMSYTVLPTCTKVAAHLAHICTEYKCATNYDAALQLAQQLHPTPAVCGTPTKEAYAMLQHIEQHHRAFYSGFLGVLGANRFFLFVNLRCMQISRYFYHLFVGGGITVDSCAQKEWEETQHKAEVMKLLIVK